MKKYILIAVACAVLSCGGSTGSSISIGISVPDTTTNVSITSLMVATVTDPDNIGITLPTSWASVVVLKAIGYDTNLCTDANIVYNDAVDTITCTPDALVDMMQYTLSISGLTDSAGTRIDPASLAFETG